jgi:hypothetical protein
MKLGLGLRCLIGLGIRLEEFHETNTNRYIDLGIFRTNPSTQMDIVTPS